MFLVPFIPSGMTSELHAVSIWVNPAAKSAGMLVAKNVQIFEIAETVKWFLSRVFDSDVVVSDRLGVWVHGKIVSMALQLTIVGSAGNRFITGGANFYFFEQRERPTVITPLWHEYHIPRRVSSGVGYDHPANNYSALNISNGTLTAAHSKPSDDEQAVREEDQRNVSKLRVAQEKLRKAWYVPCAGVAIAFFGLLLAFWRGNEHAEYFINMFGFFLLAVGIFIIAYSPIVAAALFEVDWT